MRLRTLVLALALSCGAATMVQAAGQKPVVRKSKPFKAKKYKQSKGAKVKPHKAPKHKA
jgi:cytochrome c556